MTSVCCQPNSPINATASGENRNCPNEPAAVPAPKASVRHSGGISLPKAPITTVNEEPASPKPITHAGGEMEHRRRVGVGHRRRGRARRGSRPTLSTGTAPKRSAIAPAKGWAAPQSSIWIASASANTSRPQPCALDIGVRKKPSPERGPKPRTPIRQPQTRMTAGVRQDAGRRPAEDPEPALAASLLLASCTAPSAVVLTPKPPRGAAPASPRSAD